MVQATGVHPRLGMITGTPFANLALEEGAFERERVSERERERSRERACMREGENKFERENVELQGVRCSVSVCDPLMGGASHGRAPSPWHDYRYCTRHPIVGIRERDRALEGESTFARESTFERDRDSVFERETERLRQRARV